MLVLSRKQNERILFPTLGITVEVLRAGANKVQLGIDAPREIRVIRDELHEFREAELHSMPVNEFREPEIRRELELAAQAIHRAQKQIIQGNGQRAGEALDQALRTMRQVEARFETAGQNHEPAQCIGEARARYHVDSKSLAQLVDEYFGPH